MLDEIFNNVLQFWPKIPLEKYGTMICWTNVSDAPCLRIEYWREVTIRLLF